MVCEIPGRRLAVHSSSVGTFHRCFDSCRLWYADTRVERDGLSHIYLAYYQRWTHWASVKYVKKTWRVSLSIGVRITMIRCVAYLLRIFKMFHGLLNNPVLQHFGCVPWGNSGRCRCGLVRNCLVSTVLVRSKVLVGNSVPHFLLVGLNSCKLCSLPLLPWDFVPALLN